MLRSSYRRIRVQHRPSGAERSLHSARTRIKVAAVYAAAGQRGEAIDYLNNAISDLLDTIATIKHQKKKVS